MLQLMVKGSDIQPQMQSSAQRDTGNQSAAGRPRWWLFIPARVGVTCQAVQLPMGFASHSAHAESDVLRGISFGAWDSPPPRYCVCMLIHTKPALQFQVGGCELDFVGDSLLLAT